MHTGNARAYPGQPALALNPRATSRTRSETSGEKSSAPAVGVGGSVHRADAPVRGRPERSLARSDGNDAAAACSA